MITIPLDAKLTHYELITPLDGVNYKLAFRWNMRSECWTLDVRLEDDTEILMGARVVVDWPLLRTCRHPQKPPGLLVAYDTSGKKQDPRIDDFGTRVTLSYLDASEIVALAEDLS